MAKKKQAKKFNYAVGHYWEGESGSVGCYAYGNEHFYGTMEEAKRFIYFPSLSAGSMVSAFKKDMKFANGDPVKFFEKKNILAVIL